MSNFILEARGIYKTFERSKVKVSVLKGVDLGVQKGETVAIVGSSGAGKSTLLHILGTLDEPSSGKVFFGGQEVSTRNDSERSKFRNRHLGFIFQFHHLLPEFSALENVMMPGWIAGRSDKKLKEEAISLLTEVGLAHRLNHKPGELSGGECARAAVARALILQPEIILGDEITGNLDSQNSMQLIELLLEMNRKRQVSLVLVTHDVSLASRMGRVVEMRDGKLLN